MSGQHPRRREKGDNPSQNSGSEAVPSYFVPSSQIDLEVLALYAKNFLDKSARVQSDIQPTEPFAKGWRIYSRTPINEQDIVVLIDDTTQWRREKKSSNGHALYAQSETARRRTSLGRSQPRSGGVSVIQSPKREKEPAASSQHPFRSQSSSERFAASQRSALGTSSNLSTSQYVGQHSIPPSLYGDNFAGGSRQASVPQQSRSSNTELQDRPDGGGSSSGGGSSGGGSGGGGTQPSSTGSQGFAYYSTVAVTQPSTTGSQGFDTYYTTAGPPPSSTTRYG